MNYWSYKIDIQPRDPWVDILIAKLSEIGVESFQESDEGVEAYFSEKDEAFDISSIVTDFGTDNQLQISVSKELIKQQNWNEEWESSFVPVVVDDFCIIRAPFHELNGICEHELVITPKMSFGTGHHPTTYLMVKAMKSIDFNDKNVLDMGSGTGVLGILACKLLANKVLGIDIEDWAVENAIENAQHNKANIEFKLGGKEQIPGDQFDVILANINRNILVDQLLDYANVLISGGKLLLSGFLKQDKDFMENELEKHGFAKLTDYEKDNWICLVLLKK